MPNTPVALFDPSAALAALTQHAPGIASQSTCGICGQRIVGVCGLNERGGLIHPEECPPPPPYVPPPGMLL